MTENELIAYQVAHLKELLYSEWWKLLEKELNNNIDVLQEQLDTIDSSFNEIKYNWHDILRAQKNANKALKLIIPELINKLEAQKKPDEDFEQV